MIKTLSKCAVAMALALTSIMAITTTASASRSLSLNLGGNITATSQGLVSLNGTLAGSPITTTCLVTLSGSLSRVIPKIANTLIGKIHSGPVAGCNPFLGQAISANTNIPATGWKLRYHSFSGTLPRPTAIHFLVEAADFTINIVATGSRCRFQGLVPARLGFSGTTPNTSGLVITLNPHRIPVIDTFGTSCPPFGELRANFSLAPRQTLILVN